MKADRAIADIGFASGLLGLRRYLYAADHLDIGRMYLCFAAAVLPIGGAMAMNLPDETAPGFAVLAGGQGMVMLFFCLLPAIAGVGALIVPMTIGAPNLAFPRLGNFSFWLLPFAGLLLYLSFLVPDGAGGIGFAGALTLDAPRAGYAAPGPAADFVIAALMLCLLSQLTMAINVIVTVLNFRAAGMSLRKLPPTPWSLLIGAFVQMAAVPVLIALMALLWGDRHFGTVSFNPAGGGDVFLFRHLVWFGLNGLGWAVLIPAIGIAAEIVTAFAGVAGYARRSLAHLMAVLALAGMLGWGRHLAADGLGLGLQIFFVLGGWAALLTAYLAIVLLLGALWRGAPRIAAPLLWALGFLPVFALGMLSGSVLDGGLAGVMRTTSLGAAHLPYLYLVAPLFGFFAGWYYWFPKCTGYRASQTLSVSHFASSFVGIHLAFLPSLAIDVPHAASIGIAMTAIGTALWPIGVALAFWRRSAAGNDPWAIDPAGLEWTQSSPFRGFDQPPILR